MSRCVFKISFLSSLCFSSLGFGTVGTFSIGEIPYIPAQSLVGVVSMVRLDVSI